LVIENYWNIIGTGKGLEWEEIVVWNSWAAVEADERWNPCWRWKGAEDCIPLQKLGLRE